jgi:2-methylcitrate dehydratase
MKRNAVDGLGCAFAAADADAAVATRSLAELSPALTGSSVIGSTVKTTPELAAFANATMVRCLDFNDTYLSVGGGHPSDFMPSVLAVAEVQDVSGLEFLVGLHAAYEVFASLADAAAIGVTGWDYGLFIAVAAAAGVGRVLGLNVDTMAHALSIAVTANVPLGVTRLGQLSNWKGCAGPHAAMAGCFAARLAQMGITGPAQPFVGKRGVQDLVTGEFTIGPVGAPLNGATAVERTHLKLVPTEYETQAPVAAFIELYEQGMRPEQIEGIRIRTYELAWKASGGGQGDHEEKWNPTSRETADHSIPYLISCALHDGRVTVDSFANHAILDPLRRSFMQRIIVEPDPGITARWLEDPAHEIEIEFRDGRVRRLRATRAPGHRLNPATRDAITAKFAINVDGVLGPQQGGELADLLWCLEAEPSIRAVTRYFALAARSNRTGSDASPSYARQLTSDP